MSTLETLKKNLMSMSNEQRLELLRGVREDRRISKHAITEKKARAHNKEDKIIKGFDAMTDEEKRQLIAMLGGEE